MKITFTWSSSLAFVALLFALGEAHELVHTTLGRLLCGGWGQRDFNVWELCKTCALGKPWTVAATFAGPLFTFAVGWWGYFLLAPRNSLARQSVGLALVFATIPFARILGAFMGGNDEVYGLRQLLPSPIAWTLGAAVVLLATVPPLGRAYAALRPQGRPWVFLGFFLLPTGVAFVVVLGALNSLLARGFLASYWIMGSPVLVTVWTLVVSGALGLTYRRLATLGQAGVVR
ncbi:MAG: hypothetical protein H7Z21_05815 [Hymenobacter sp.]|nr:hypothetical protein [Hymenobacter sp.]